MPTTTTETADIAIVGAGPAGALYAARLAHAGRRVVVFEAGPAWRLSDLVSSQLWARRLKWGGAPLARGGAHPFGHNYATGWGLGGAALHHYAGWPRLRPEDFRLRTLFGRGADWPFDYAALRPYYDRIQEEIGLAGDLAREPWRRDESPYPLPPLPLFHQAEVIARGFTALGKSIAPTPVAINTTPHNGRPACVYDGWCDAGCPTGALANPLITHLPQALSGGADIRTGHTVTRIRCDGRGRAIGLAYRDAHGESHRIAAPLIVLAASTTQNVRLLLHSRGTRRGHGLGNASGLVGRYFFCHGILNVYGLFSERLDNHVGVIVPPWGSTDDYGKDRGIARPFGSYTWGIAPALKPNDLVGIATTRADLFGSALDAFMHRAARHLGSIVAMLEAVAEIDNRIEWAGGRDVHGVPLARIVHGFGTGALALAEHARVEGLALMRAAGAGEAWASPILTAHLLGGTRMGTDPRTSVCNEYGQLHEHPNVIVAGGGLFPSCGAASPTYTVLAVSLRSVERLLAAPPLFTA